MQVVKSNQSYSAFNSSSDPRSTRSKTWHNCYKPDATLLLVFDVKEIEPEFKQRIRDLWKVLNGLSVCDKNPRAENLLLVDEKIKEDTPEPVENPAEEDGARLLFQKMLGMRMDQHALAIADGYRTRPQVCVCDNVCCNCFDYSNFLHNLKLHNHKELLRMVYAKMTNEGMTNEGMTKPAPKSEIAEPSKDGEEASSQGEIYDEFTFKNEEDYEDDDPNDVDLDLTIIDRVKKMVCSEKTVCPEKNVSAPALKVKRGVRVIQIDEPPYETKFNTVHRRVREFDPNMYKNLIREEIKRLGDMSVSERRSKAENRIKNLSQRPPWKI